MALFCACTGTLQNTGKPSNQKVITDGSTLILVPLFADDGTRNEIDEGDTINAAYISALINNADASKRWYPVGSFVNVTDERADPITESFADGSSVVTQQGVRTFTGWLTNYSSKYVDILNSYRCDKFGVYTVDECGDLVGSLSSDGTKLRPIKVNEGSFYATLQKASDTVGGKVQLTFEFSQTEKDESLRKIDASEITGSFEDIEGLIEVDIQNATASGTSIALDLRIVYDNFLADTVVTGWTTTTDYDIYNVTTSSSITPSGVTEAPDGTYDITVPALTASHIIRVRVGTTKTGYWMEELITAT